MNYVKMQKVAIKLLQKFGNTQTCFLLKKENGKIVSHKGVGVKLDYNSEAIGSNNNMIKAGDAKLLCYFDVEPTEMVDIIKFKDDTFSIINAGALNPNGLTNIMFTLQIRRT